MPDLARLDEHFRGLGRVVLGYSGGVDSGLLAVVGTRVLGPKGFLAVLGVSPSLPQAQYRAARDLARRYRIPVAELPTRELDDPRYTANRPDRCYHCKDELWTRLGALAARRGFDAVVDGTNADDLEEHRPGAAAARRHGVRSPLADLGWRKQEVRDAARALGLPIWDRPAAPCLSSRIRYGLAVTPERLRQVERGEAYLRRLGVTGNVRVRHLGHRARVEVDPDQFALLDRHWERVVRAFRRVGFGAVERSPDGYRRGALLVLAADS
jgi:uncharacterized protein